MVQNIKRTKFINKPRALVFQHSQRATLQALLAQAKANGVNDVEDVDKQTAQLLEPELHCVQALLSPSTGIVDSHRYRFLNFIVQLL